MAVDIGEEAIDRAATYTEGETIVNIAKRATVAGIVNSIDIWAVAGFDITGLIVGTFYTTNGNTLKCRDSEAIAGTIIGGGKVVKAVSIAVEIDDYIGCYFTGGRIELSEFGDNGVWYKSGNHINPDDEEDYIIYSARAMSLGGYIGVAGWTGKISGVTNPAKIMGVDVANIKSVKGVE